MRLIWCRLAWRSKMYCPEFLRRAACVALVASLLTACSGSDGGGGGAAPAPVPAPPSSNVLNLTVDRGPAGNNVNNVNRLYTDVTICQPGSATQCQTIDHVLVDTGSTGLRLLASIVTPALNLVKVNAAGGFPLLNCANFVDNSFAFGPVVTADVVLAGKTAASMPIQIIADPAFTGLAAACSSGSAINTVASIGAKGVIGLGLFQEDCGVGCANVTANGFYFTCTSAACSATIATRASASKQLKNPVPLFASDNNGFLIDLPAVSPPGAASLSGALIFGIGTQANNRFTAGSVLTTDSLGNFTTLFEGRTLSKSFLDSGSNGLYFDSAAIPTCGGVSSAAFYCPPAFTTLLARQVGANGVSIPISFSIDNALALFVAPIKPVLPNLAGPIRDARTFDWGLPFYYGRRVFLGIEGQTSGLGIGPFHAY